MKKIILVGAGNIGQRHLQSILNSTLKVNIYIYDPSVESIAKCAAMCKEFFGITSHGIYFLDSLNQAPKIIDLAIVATNADCRLNAVRSVLKWSKVKYWILEKVLAQNSISLIELEKCFEYPNNVWVNLNRRTHKWHQEIKNNLDTRSPIIMEVAGEGWGLGCNGLHFLDLLEWLSGEKIQEICTDGLSEKWFPSKRRGMFEVGGGLTAIFSGGSRSTMSISRVGGSENYTIGLSDSSFSWAIDELKGEAISSDGRMILGKLPFQSEVTSGYIEEIFTTGASSLPSINEAIPTHSKFLDGLLEHYRRHMDSKAKFLPIT